MTNITFKNGLPLLLQPAPGSDFGLVAADSGCCCPPPPPERCWDCLDLCSYIISVTEPAELAASGNPVLCETGQSVQGGIKIAFMYPGVLPASLISGGGEGFSNDSESIVLGYSTGAVRHSYSGIVRVTRAGDCDPGGATIDLPIGVSGSVSVGVRCVNGAEPSPFLVSIVATATVRIGNFLVDEKDDENGCVGSWSWSASISDVSLPATCVAPTGNTCPSDSPVTGEIRVLDTPVDISADADGTSVGAYTSETTSPGIGASYADLAAEVGEAMRDALTATFRITARENCEPLPDPCTVLVDGVRVPVSSFNPYEVITAKWRGLSAPGRNLVLVDGVVIQDIDGGSYDGITDITTAGCDAPSQTDDVKAVHIATGGSGIVNACATGESIAKYQPLVCEVVDENTARLYGGVSTVKLYTPCEIGGAPSGDDILEENQWSWECLLENGVPGAVTVSPSVGARYFNADPVVCAVTHEPPVVTLDFVP